MAIMPARTYAAFKEAGVPEDDAIAATESLAAYENRFTNLENCLGSKEARLSNVENRLDHLDSRLRAVETNVAILAGKITVLTWRSGSTPRQQSRSWAFC